MNIVETIRTLKDSSGNFLDTTLQYIQYEMSGILKDVARIHLTSAEQAFIAATTSNNSEGECRVGIGHLRDSFNAFQIYLDRGDKWFGGLFYTKWELEETTSIQLRMASIALVISLTYKRLGDESNYITWKSTGYKFATEYLNKRAIAIGNWKDAKKSNMNGGGNGGGATYSADLAKRQAYKDELLFIDLFTKEIKNV